MRIVMGFHTLQIENAKKEIKNTNLTSFEVCGYSQAFFIL